MKFSDFAKKNVKESAVGKVGRTSIDDAEIHLNDNPALYKEFKKIVKQLGGKSVARRLLDTLSSPIGCDIHKDESAKIEEGTALFEIEKILRDNGFKIKKITKDSIILVGSKKPADAEKLLKDYNVNFTDDSIELN